MGLLKVFVSSTCYDLKAVREVIGNFITELGHEPIMCESNIYYKQYCLPEQSCYDEIEESDILVHIIGGSFGSDSQVMEDISVAEAEVVTAIKLHKPIFIFLYNPVLQEYYLYEKNKKRKMRYNVVKNPKVFSFIEYIYGSNLPVYQYESMEGLKQTLKRQLSYLFRDRLQEGVINKRNFFEQNYVNVSKEFIEDFEACDSLLVLGLGQNRMIKSYYGIIKKKVLDNKNVCYVLADPDGGGAEMCAKFGSLQSSLSDDAKIHKDAINLLLDIKMLNPDYLRIKIVDIFPPFTMYAFNAEDINQLKMYIWFTPIYLPAIQRLGFKLTGKHDKELCQMFIEQFNSLYNSVDSQEIVSKY